MLVARSTTPLTLLRLHWPRVIGVGVIVALVEVGNDYVGYDRPVFTMPSLAIVVTALSIFLGFRVNEAYARWWEARTLWGGIVNASRTFARQARTLVTDAPDSRTPCPDVEALRRELIYRQVAFANTLRLELRREEDWSQLDPFLTESDREALEVSRNKAHFLLSRQSERIAEIRAMGLMSDIGQLRLDQTLADLQNHQGGCERIKNTPFPENVSFFNRFMAWGLAVLIPISILGPVHQFDIVELIVVPAIMLTFLVTEQLGAELKNPFENRPNDTPMSAICRTIEIDLRQQLGEQDLPEPLQRVGNTLM